MIQLLFLCTENKYCEIQITCKGYPQKIGHLQGGGKGTYFFVMKNCEKNGRPEKQKPDERKKKSLHIEEYNAPEEVKKQADSVKNE